MSLVWGGITSVLRFLLLANIKIVAGSLCRWHVEWLPSDAKADWANVRLVVILNHTSLLEPIYSGVLPWSMIWRIATRAVFPAADVTTSRPIVGRIMKSLAPGVISVSRERDHTWTSFLQAIRGDRMVMILPEGRMKRPGGLDKAGRPMTVRGGVADILDACGEGKMLIVYSGGLHQVHVPGQSFLRLFQKLAVAFESVSIQDYNARLGGSSSPNFKSAVIKDLESRRDLHCPRLEAICMGPRPK